jgi:hypothetical protein
LPDVLLLLTNRTFLFTKRSFSSALSMISGDLTKRYPAFSHALSSSDALLQILHSIGVIGIVRDGKPVYNYQVASDQTPEPGDKEFAIHPAFRFALQSELGIGTAPFKFDAGFLQRRVERGIRGTGEQAVNPHYLYSASGTIMRQLDVVLMSIKTSDGSDELKKALTRNVASVQKQLRQKTSSETHLRLKLEQALRYVSDLANTLAQDAVGVDGEVLDELKDLIRTLRDSLGGGTRQRGGVTG